MPVYVALRTYSLALSLSLSPSLLPFLVDLVTKRRLSLSTIKRILTRELRYDGFASAITVALAGGNAIRCLAASRLSTLFRTQLTPSQKTFISTLLSSAVGLALLQSGRRRWRRLQRPGMISLSRDSTLDLTMLLFVRALDVLLQLSISRVQLPRLEPPPSEKERQDRRSLTSRVDAFIFWACSARQASFPIFSLRHLKFDLRIMWCFFYEPQRLPRSYVKWIGALANVDGRLLQALNLLRDGKRWSYLRGSAEYPHLLTSYSQDLGFPKEWGDPSRVPPYGGQSANPVWQTLGVQTRSSVGGIPCEVVHGRVGQYFGLSSSCTTNAFLRGVTAFIKAVAIYLPVHFLPILLTRPKSLLRAQRALTTFIAALRSAFFLSTFVASYWYAVCLTRTLALARLFPWISHDYWDGPYGCLLTGSLACGNSIWIENGRRRGEMALYVLPRALRTCMPNSWLNGRNKLVSLIERLTFILSFSTLVTAAIHRPDTLRGLSRWTLAFIMKVPNAGFWKHTTPRHDDDGKDALDPYPDS
ncbi:hypothetical protein F5887DRAFT_1223544 [Amanita rubescens]|nr:hypothetical protein F5887DRAFT_1223544 [Amanita rubescens]